jgi:hypothetical protein
MQYRCNFDEIHRIAAATAAIAAAHHQKQTLQNPSRLPSHTGHHGSN